MSGTKTIFVPVRVQDLTNKTFGRWHVLCFGGFTGKKPNRVTWWYCRCDCGSEKLVVAASLKNGDSRSCGCFAKEQAKRKATLHGGTGTREYNIWRGMLDRCYNEASNRYCYYGGRGIEVCCRWRNAFSAFLSDMGSCPAEYQIERKDNGGDYTPENCCWASRTVNQRNKRTSLKLAFRGETRTLKEWQELLFSELRIGYHGLYTRIYTNGWSIEKALTTPFVKHKERKWK